MITLEQLETALGDNKDPYKINKNVDIEMLALTLLRNKIPYEVCTGIINAAEHDVIYLCDAEKALPYLNEEDLITLADCNVCYDASYSRLFIFA